MKKIIILLILLIFSACHKETQELSTKKEEVNARTIKVTKSKVDDYYEVSGSVVSRNPIAIVSKVMGTVASVNVDEGSYVKRGDLLVILDAPDIKASLDRADGAIKETEKAINMAKSNLQFAENTYKRYENLYNQQAISRQEFENIKLKRDQAEDEVKRLEAALSQAKAEKTKAEGVVSYLKIISPVDGVVTEKKANIGMNILPGMPLLTVETTDRLRLEVMGDEKILPVIKKGMSFPVYFEAIKKEVKGVVSDFVPAVESTTRTFKIKIDLPKDKDIVIGLYGTVKIPIGKTEKIYIPRKAVLEKGQLSYVYVLDSKSQATMRLIRLGKELESQIEVLSGLSEGEIMVEEITEAIKEGVIIRGEDGKKGA